MLSIEKLTPILDVLPDALQLTNSQGTIVYINQSFIKLTGITKSERLQKNIYDLSPNSAIAQALENKQPVVEYHTYIGKNMTAVITNAYPLITGNTIQGAIEVLKPLSEHVMTFEKTEKLMIQRALDIYGRSMKGKLLVAKSLNISLATLYNKIKKYNI